MSTPWPDEAARLDQLRDRLAQVGERIASACQAAGRPAGDVTLIAITKTFPATDVALLAGLGVADFGENRDQEAAPKAALVAEAGLAPRWHFVGQLQVNKAASVVRYADFVHSVDRHRLVRALGSHAVAAGRLITCLVQVNLDESTAGYGTASTAGYGGAGSGGGASGAGSAGGARGGALPAEVPALAEAIAGTDGLVLGGVMAVAPLGRPARPAFRRLAEIAAEVVAVSPAAKMISAGMSGDLDEAIAEGATHVRVGTALLGGRPPFVR
ncbi:MAG TPA: YggS family pyridoxal phosphate enzyme [Streptosporangiaceae bacterium]|nr:YggS family pyridoxal phosphate enzyme [Streptosporangiaceae bacterium]